MTATLFREPKVGAKVLLHTPDNPRANGHPATVAAVSGWGAHLTTAFGSGAFRALWAEMLMLPAADRPTVAVPARTPAGKEAGYSGESCPTCQGSRMVRSGTCATCQDCGSTSGCS